MAKQEFQIIWYVDDVVVGNIRWCDNIQKPQHRFETVTGKFNTTISRKCSPWNCLENKLKICNKSEDSSYSVNIYWFIL